MTFQISGFWNSTKKRRSSASFVPVVPSVVSFDELVS